MGPICYGFKVAIKPVKQEKQGILDSFKRELRAQSDIYYYYAYPLSPKSLVNFVKGIKEDYIQKYIVNPNNI